MNKQEAGFTPLERSSYYLNGMKKYIARMWLKSQPNFQTGFTLIELIIAMVMFLLVIVAASNVFTSLLTQFKQQSKITETQIEGIIGLELLRQDIEHAGYGLPWVIPTDVSYSEAASSPASTYNDATSNPPRAILSGNSMTFSSPNDIFDGTDYLAIKAINVARSDTAQRWTRLLTGNVKRDDLSGDSFADDDRVIIISPGSTKTNSRTLVVDSTDTTPPLDWDTTYNATLNFDPDDATETHVIYGIKPPGDPVVAPSMPFNRADYYIWRGSADPATDDVPDRCAINTGVLRKAVVNHSAGTFSGGILPLLDCVADMQVIYRLDMDDDDQIGTTANADGSVVTSTEGGTTGTVLATFADAALLRQRLKEVRVYVLAHEGQRDPDYTFTNFTCAGNCITVGEFGLGRDFDLTAITDWEDYRWKVYTLVVKLNNLGG